MDYNENDFQSQNHHLAGEGNNKFSPVLRPYALPKFDFDESLQGHLRFDSLVETEVFLEIENEDNRWIEDYSRGSCGIEFSKSRIDSCTIPRCNNVWSEATSSESVEMLLKSVGQEEIITRQSVGEVSYAFDELSCLTKRMEPNVKHDTIFSSIGDVEDLQSAFSLDGFPENSSRSKDDYPGDQSQVEASLQVDCGESSLGNNLCNSDLRVSDQCLLEDDKCMGVSGSDVSNLVDECGKENVTCTELKMEDVICNTQNIITDTLKSQEDLVLVEDVSAVSEDSLQKDNDLSRDKLNAQKFGLVNQSVDFEIMDHQNLDREATESTSSYSVNPVSLSSDTETIEERNASRHNVIVPMEVSDVVTERSSDAETLEGCAGSGRTSQASDQCLLEDDKCMGVSGSDVSKLVFEFGKENVTCTEVQVEDVICNTQNIINDTLKSQEDLVLVEDVSAVTEDNLQKDNNLSGDKMNDQESVLVNQRVDCEIMDHQNLDREANESKSSYSVNPVSLSADTETIEEQNASRHNVNVSMEVSDVVTVRSSDAETLEGYVGRGRTSQATQHEDDVSFIDASASDTLKEDMSISPAVVHEGDKETNSNIEAVSNVTVDQLAGNERAADPPEQGTDVERADNLFAGQLVIENVHSDCVKSLHSVMDKVSVNDGDGKDCASMELPTEAKLGATFEGSKVESPVMAVDLETQGASSQQTVTREKFKGNIPDAHGSDSVDVCQERSEQLHYSSGGPVVTDSQQTITIEKLEVNILDTQNSDLIDVPREQSKQLLSGSSSEDGGPVVTDSHKTLTVEKLEGNILDAHGSDSVDATQEQSKQLSGSSSEDGGPVVTDSQQTLTREKLEGDILDARSSDSVDVCQEKSKQLLSGSSIEDGGPVLTDGCLATSTPSNLVSTEDVSDCTEVQRSVEVVPPDSSPRDVVTLNQNTNSPVAIKHSPVHKPVNGALSGTEELSLHDTTSQSLPEEEGAVDTKSNNDSQLAKAQVFHQGPNSVEVNIHHMMRKDGTDVDTIVTSAKDNESTLASSNKLEFEVSGDVSKTSQSTLAPAPIAEGCSAADVLEDGSDQADADKMNSTSITASESADLSLHGNENGMKSLPVEDIGISEVKGDPVIDNPHLSSPKDIDASKIEKSSASQIVEASPLASGLVQSDPQTQQGGIHGGSQASDKENTKQKPKGTSERKARRISGKAAGRESARKGIQAKDSTPSRQSESARKPANQGKDSTPSRQSESERKPANLSKSSPGIYQLVQSNEIMQHRQIDGTSTKPFGILTTPTSRLPDLNSTAFPSLVFQQPFIDSQQIQLRAQIFVYGSLISKQIPEDSHMEAAFGGPDTRSMWEKAWQACNARTPSQTSVNQETPSRSGNVASDPVVKQTGLQTKALSTPIGRSSTIGTPSSAVKPMIPLSSPLWNIPTPSHDAVQSSGMPRGSVVNFQQAFSQMAPQQTPPIISYVGPNNSTWMAQPPFRGPWAASPQTPALETSAPFPSLSTETVQLTPVRESSTSMKHTAPVSSTQGGGHAGGLVVSSASHDLKKAMGPSSQPSSDPKRKRKRASTSEGSAKIGVSSQLLSEKVSAKISLLPQSLSGKGSIPIAACSVYAPISAAVADNFLKKDAVVELNVVSSPSVAAGPTKDVDQGLKKPVLSEDAICNAKEAGQRAEEASALAAAAVSHSQQVWGEVYKKQNSGLVPATEAKLASAAVAIAAAAAVAKAAAAAANVASHAALQAKLMADEALSLDSNTSDEGTNVSSSIITAAKEAARRRVQATSAAALRAENLDAIVKAAELAAEAISQAGKVVAMGDPLPLSKLAEAGPDGFWKLDMVSSDRATMTKDGISGQPKADKAATDSSMSRKDSDGTPGDQEAHTAQHGVKPGSQDNSRNSKEEELRLIVGISGSVTPTGMDTRGQQFEQSSEPAESASVNFESESGLGAKNIEMKGEYGNAADAKIYNGIREGSVVEVFKDADGYKGAWFSAKVMNLKGGKVHVCYSELSSTEGSGKLNDWIDLTSEEEGHAPKIRVPHPLTAMQYEGSRKRRRAAVGYLTCSVGDKVDAWMRDSWWEGVVTEKNKNDETSLTVSFPALGEISVVKAWNLRPSLIWKDREWVEWSYAKETGPSLRESDTPQQKRAKLGIPANEAKGKDKESKAVEKPKLAKPEESKSSLDLSDKEKSFTIGTSVDNRKPDLRKPARPGIRKEGPGVVFGVPKPGKKRKFMEVNVGDRDKKVEVGDSVKLANYLMPRRTGPRGLKASKSIDPKENQGDEVKGKGPKSLKEQGASFRAFPQRNNPRSSESTPKGSAGSTFSTSKGSVSEGPFLFSSQAPSSAARKTSSGAASRSETGNRGRFAPAAAGKLAKIEENKVMDGNALKATPNTNEPRRSIRRIQPTSRLLEGLQSSLLISKIPSSSSHDKSNRNPKQQTKTVPKGKNQS